MPTQPLLAVGKHRPCVGLLDSLQQWQDADLAAAPETVTLGLRVIDAHRATIERAKAALMRRYGLDSLPAFAVLVRWSRLTQTPVHILAGTLVNGLREADPWTVNRDRRLIRWLEDQLLETVPLFLPGPQGGRRIGQGAVPLRLRTLEPSDEPVGAGARLTQPVRPALTRRGEVPATSASTPDLAGNMDEKQDTPLQRVAHTMRHLASRYLANRQRPPAEPSPSEHRPYQRGRGQRPTGTASQPTPSRDHAEAS